MSELEMDLLFLQDLPVHLPNANPIENDIQKGDGSTIDLTGTKEQQAPLSTDENSHCNEEKTDAKVENKEEFQDDKTVEEAKQITGCTNDFKNAVKIPGTNITLQTEEDIAKWIEERKRNWPSAANLARKRLAAETKLKRNPLQLNANPKTLQTDNRNHQRPQRKRSASTAAAEEHEGEGEEEGGGGGGGGGEEEEEDKDGKEEMGEYKEELGKLKEQHPNKKNKSICRFYLQYGKCKFGNRCKNIHEAATDLNSNSNSKSNPYQNANPNPNPVASNHNNSATHTKRTINGVTVLIPKLYANRTENTRTSKSSLFKHLVSHNQMQHENTIVIDFIKYLDEKGLIDHDIMKSKF
ncbi:hypothetical protein LELG_02121 [Lodderomyces elongisporus NRRL YB-4239]|uniref:C3H1-type domain-containing protein n=1 Tax=Lodderomyces elongisporus (strain ATCC 11503 / CBS 2605 / JCM 1781 / NBRC 1676 / NRRL YB-4239) TaxID=379508 RepID=A5DXN4_LODEL|nr:hypothetical protein LELG_02121 [Lodderomyces elongisporus NRRL YB-4239]